MKFAPQTHLFTGLALLANLAAPALVRADPPHSNVICARINTPKAKVDEAERNRSREKLFNSWKDTLENTVTKRHRTEFASVAQPSINAQNNFFDFMKIKVRNICEVQLQAEIGVTGLSAKIAETQAIQDKHQMCDRFGQLEAAQKTASEGMSTVNKGLSDLLGELKKTFVQFSRENLQNLETIPDAGKGLLSVGPAVKRTWWQTFFGGGPKPRITTLPSLKEEAAILWGTNAKGMEVANFRADPNSFFGGIMSRLENDLKTSERFVQQLDQHNGKVQELRELCTGIDPVAADPTKAAATDDTTPGSSEEDLPNPYADDNSQPEATDTDPPVDTTIPDDPKEKDGIGDEDENASAPPPTIPPPKVKEEGWISKNKGMLITLGAGAAAVGGILWYKKSQDKKAQDELAMLDAEASARAALMNSNSGSNSSSSGASSPNLGGPPANTASPHGSKLIVSGIPTGAAVNADLSTITVSIIDPQGIQTFDSLTGITVGCSTPAGCSLAGTLTVNTNGGKAEFNDLRFTAPHEGVKLIFSAPGFASVESTQPFNVTGTATEAPRE